MKKIVQSITRALARRVIDRYKPLVIGITGSVGKTMTKEAIYTVVSRHFHARKSEGNFNTELGIPLMILNIPADLPSRGWWGKLILVPELLKALWLAFGYFNFKYPEVLVLELAADKPGDIEYLVNICKPNIGVVTAVGEVPVHVEFYSGPEEVAAQKSLLIKHLPDKGLAVLNQDEQIVWQMGSLTKAKKIGFGFNANADPRAGSISYIPTEDNTSIAGIKCTVSVRGSEIEMRIPALIAPHQLYSVLAATAIGVECGVHLVDIAADLETLQAPPSRLRLIDGLRQSTIIDDTYNSSPIAAAAALDILAEMRQHLIKLGNGGKSLAILGDMKELGKYEQSAHEEIGKKAISCAEELIFVGPAMRHAYDSAIKTFDKEYVWHFESWKEAMEKSKEVIKRGDLVLIKGSQSMRLEKITKALMAHPEDASHLLCRQYGKWLRD